VTLNVLDRLKRLPGTTNVQIFGAKDYAMRIWLKPDRLAQLKLTPGDVANAINEQNAQFAAGKVGQSPIGQGQDLVYTITSKGRLADPAQFSEIIVRANPDGSTVRLADVARVELGSRDYEFNGRYNGRPATLVGIFLQPGANALDVAKSVQATVDELAALPRGPDYAMPYDTTRFVEVSIERGAEDARRGDAAGVPGGVPVPAELARGADPARRRAGVADRHLRRHACCSAIRSTR
jgi:multidrug efflux pump subunit AcrB